MVVLGRISRRCISLFKCSRILAMTLGSVMKDRMRNRPPQEQRSGSVLKEIVSYCTSCSGLGVGGVICLYPQHLSPGSRRRWIVWARIKKPLASSWRRSTTATSSRSRAVDPDKLSLYFPAELREGESSP